MPWGVFGEASVFVIFPNPARLPVDPASFDPLKLGFKGLKGGFVSAAHGPREIAQTLDAFRSALRALKSSS